MRIRLERPGPEGPILFRLRSGSVPDFARTIVPYGVRARLRDENTGRTRVSSRDVWVEVDAAMRACGALGGHKHEIYASREVQAVIVGSAWKCTSSKLYPFQRAGAEFLHGRTRAVLADQMGVGKTVQALTALDAQKGALVVVPPVVVGSWYDEARRWRPELRTAIWKRPYSIFPGPGEINIASYAMLPFDLVEERTRCPFCNRLSVISLAEPSDDSAMVDVPQDAQGMSIWTKEWKNLCDKTRGGCGKRFDQRSDVQNEHVWIGEKPKTPVQLVVDEAHYCKSRKARRTISVRAIAKQSSSVWLLTGTPLLNSPEELWSLCQTFPGPGPFDTGAHDTFGSWGKFVEMFHGKKKKYGGYDWAQAGDAAPEARARLGSIMLRRMRQQVLPELPKKTRRFLQVEIDERGLPHWGTKADLDKFSDDRVLAECGPDGTLSTVRMKLAERKLDVMMQLASEYEETDEPVIAFSYHRGPIEALGARKGWGCITGSTPDRERALLVAAFQAGDLKGIAGTIGAMGVGVTLTKAANVLFLDRDFVPANNLQGEDRALRIGQKRAVVITILMTNHPVDLRVRDVLEKKERMLEAMELADEDVKAEVRFRKGKLQTGTVGK